MYHPHGPAVKDTVVTQQEEEVTLLWEQTRSSSCPQQTPPHASLQEGPVIAAPHLPAASLSPRKESRAGLSLAPALLYHSGCRDGPQQSHEPAEFQKPCGAGGQSQGQHSRRSAKTVGWLEVSCEEVAAASADPN